MTFACQPLFLDEKLEVSKIFIDEGYITYHVIKYSDVSSSTWYNRLNRKVEYEANFEPLIIITN